MNQIISGNKLAELCNHIFSQTALDKSSSAGYKIIVNVDVIEKIESGQSVFVKTDFLFDFFKLVQSRRDLDKIKLVTHDSDRVIDQHIVDNIPACISKMFSINVCVNDSRITPIPIGIANDYCNITFKPQIQKDFSAKGIKALIACNVNNNISERLPLYTHKFDKDVTIINRSISLHEYETLIRENDFIFCPEGNGPDTHRVWETLYEGKIPIVKKNIWNNSFRDLPILFVDNLLDCNEHVRKDFIQSNFLKFTWDKSMLDFWKNALI